MTYCDTIYAYLADVQTIINCVLKWTHFNFAYQLLLQTQHFLHYKMTNNISSTSFGFADAFLSHDFAGKGVLNVLHCVRKKRYPSIKCYNLTKTCQFCLKFTHTNYDIKLQISKNQHITRMHAHTHARTHTHTHARFNGPLSKTTQVSRYQKGKNNLDFTKARKNE